MRVNTSFTALIAATTLTMGACGGGGGGSKHNNNNTPKDNPPVISAVSPQNGEIVSNTVTIEATVSDDKEVQSVRFSLGAQLLSTDTATPYRVSWDSFAVLDNVYTITVVATDSIGQTTSSFINLTTQNDFATKINLSFGPYEGLQDPNLRSTISRAQIRRKVGQLPHYSDVIRTFGNDTTANLNAVPEIADEFGMCVAIGIWLDNDKSTNDVEVDGAIRTAQTGCVKYIIVGSEVLRRGDLTLASLIEYIERVQRAVPGIPVTTGAIYPTWLHSPELVDVVDILFVNFYPFWEGIALQNAISALNTSFNLVETISDGKRIIVSETGWPSCGDPVDDAIPSEANAAFYFKAFVTWLEFVGVEGFYFEAFDELWKANYGEGSRGACWGIFRENGTPKPGMLDVFRGVRHDDILSLL